MRTVRKLRDTDLASVNYTEDIRGHAVIDSDGRHVGEVESLFLDEAERRIRFFCVAHDAGGAADGEDMGEQDQRWLVPVDAIVSIRSGSVRLDRPREELVPQPQDAWLRDAEQNVNRLYQQYGYEPFWSAGYAYPPFPFYA